MHIRILLFVGGIGWGLTIGAQTLRPPLAAAYTGLGAYSREHSDAFSFMSNPAALVNQKSMAMGVYGERKYMLKELSQYQLVAVFPSAFGNFGGQLLYAGFSGCRETQIGFSYGRGLGRQMDAGLQFGFQQLAVAGGYGSATAITCGLGLLMHFTGHLHAGINISNPIGGKWGRSKEEKLAAVYRLGLGYEASPQFYVSAMIEKVEAQPVNVQSGIQYRFLPVLLLRAGISSSTSSGWLGVGLQLEKFRVDLTTAAHPQLGLSPGLLLHYAFGQNPSKK